MDLDFSELFNKILFFSSFSILEYAVIYHLESSSILLSGTHLACIIVDIMFMYIL